VAGPEDVVVDRAVDHQSHVEPRRGDVDVDVELAAEQRRRPVDIALVVPVAVEQPVDGGRGGERVADRQQAQQQGGATQRRAGGSVVLGTAHRALLVKQARDRPRLDTSPPGTPKGRPR
jgi:hypothetical protein